MASFVYSQAGNILSKLRGKDFEENSPNYIYRRSMEYNILILEDILWDAEEMQEHGSNLHKWLLELQDVFYQIEDTIDNYKMEAKKVYAPLLCSNPVGYKSQSAHKMRELRDKFDKMTTDLYEFHLIKGNEKHLTHSFISATKVSTRLMMPNWQLGYPLMGTRVIYKQSGYEDTLKALDESTDKFVHIVGDAGIGKSTLAKYFENRTMNFIVKNWLCMRKGFDTRRLIKEILSFGIGTETYEHFTNEQLLSKVKRRLSDTTFLLVFQDLSIDNLDDPTMFKQLAEMGNSNSKIVVTSQSKEVADLLGHEKVYNINGLSEANSFALFKEYAFQGAQSAQQNTELMDIAKQIVQKCRGVPLAIKCLGGMLSSKTRVDEWKKVNEDKIWTQKEKDDGIPPALRLCYNLMPSYLKRCFLYCSQLPNDRICTSNDLIQMWMAHGLLHSPEEKKLTLENIGEKYFNELWSKCFFQDISEHAFGYWFKMHPLIRKLACVVAQERVESSVGATSKITSIAFQEIESVPPSSSLVDECISRFRYLRLLYLGSSNFQEIPNSIGTLKYLRYLDLQDNKRIKRLPNSICDLQSLQTLILASCPELDQLPNDIKNLTNLRYLWITTNQLRLQKNGIGTMTSLRFLAIGECENLENLFEQPQCLAALETLMIYDCKTLKSLPSQIKSLKSLQNLVIWRCKMLTLTLNEEVEFSLQRLTIRDLPKVNILPEWLQRSRETLRILNISNCPIIIDGSRFSTFEAMEKNAVYGIVKYPQVEGFTLDYVNISFQQYLMETRMEDL